MPVSLFEAAVLDIQRAGRPRGQFAITFHGGVRYPRGMRAPEGSDHGEHGHMHTS